jgi:hypothetical protein
MPESRARANVTPRSRIARAVAIVVLHASLAVGLTWPLVRDLDGGVPLGTETVATVPLASLWSLWWNADRLTHGYSGYWDAPIFHPTAGAFAFSEAHPLSGLVAAALAPLTDSLPAAYNVILLLALTLNGSFASKLLLALDVGLFPAVSGGAIVVALPFVHQELGVLALVPVVGILASFLTAVRFVRSPGVGTGAGLGAALAATYLLCGYYGLMTGLLLAFTLPVLLLGRIGEARLWRGVAAASVVAAAVVLPVALPQREAALAQGFERSEATVLKHSARPSDYLLAAWPALLPAPGGVAARPSLPAFWPGTLRILLAVIGVVAALGHDVRRRWAIWLVALAGLAFLLSLGPRGAIGPWSLHDLLHAGLPGYAQMRSLFRCAVVFQLSTVLLAAFGLDVAWRAAVRRGRGTVVASAMLGLLACAELWPRPGEIQPLPPLNLDLAWVRWIESHTPQEAVLAFIPFPRGRDIEDYLGTAQWMYWQMRHGRPMVNGYSSFFPASFRALKRDLGGFPDARSVLRLGESGVQFCIVHRAFAGEVSAAGVSGGEWRLERVASDPEAAIDIYRVVGTAGPE